MIAPARPGGPGGVMISPVVVAAAAAWPPPPPLPSVSVSAWVMKSGTAIAFGVTSSATPAAGAEPTPAPIRSVSASPTVYRNGHAIQLGVPIYYSSTTDTPIVWFRLNCGTVRTIAMPPGGSGSGYTAATVTWNGDGGGTSLVLGTPVLKAGVITWVPIASCSDDFTSRPTFTVTDATGTGAVLYAIMNGVKPGDTITFSAARAWCSPVLGGVLGGSNYTGGNVQEVSAVTNAPVANWTGQFEGPGSHGAFGCFAQVPTLIPGLNVGSQPGYPGGITQTAKNKAMLIGNWTISGGGVLTADAANHPVSWTLPASSTIRGWCHGTLGSFSTAYGSTTWPSQAGNWTLQYDDPNAGTPQAMTVTLGARVPVTQLSRTTTGTTITAIYQILYPAGTTNWELDVAVYAMAVAGAGGRGYWTITGLKVVPPDNRDGSAQPVTHGESDWLPDPNMTRSYTGVGVTRWADANQGYMGGPDANYVMAGDASWERGFNWYVPNTPPLKQLYFHRARYLNTDPNSSTYPWSVTTLAGPQGLFNPPIPLPPGDDGFSLGNSNTIVLELIADSPHGLVTGYWPSLWAPAGSVAVPILGMAATTYAPTTQTSSLCYVTGPDTIAVALYAPNIAPASDQPMRIGATTAIDLTAGGTLAGWQLTVMTPANSVPYGVAAAATAPLPGCAVWLNLPVFGSDALIGQIAREVVGQLGPTNPIFLELGNEVWNGTSLSGAACGVVSRLLQNIAAGTTILGGRYLGTGARPTYGIYAGYVPLAAYVFDVFTAAAVAAGCDAARIKRVYGSFWMGDNYTSFIVQQAQAGIPVDYIAVAPYWQTPNDPTMAIAFANQGSAVAGNESWPVDALADVLRHSFAYSMSWNNKWNAHSQWLRASHLSHPPELVCYEAAYETVAVGTSYATNLQIPDLFAHPAARDLIAGIYAACQRGTPTVAGSGATHANYYQCYAQPPVWYLAEGCSIPAGPGTNNQYMSYQGGYPADTRLHSGGNPGSHNDSPALQGVLDWAAARAAGRPL